MADDLSEYRAFLLQQPCASVPCVGAVDVHHPKHRETHAPWQKPAKALGGKPGKGQRASDWYGIPMCPHCHSELHDGRGKFKGHTKTSLRIWQDKEIVRLQELWWETHDLYPNEKRVKVRIMPGAKRPRRAGLGWTVPLVIDLLTKEARHRPGDVSAAFLEVVGLIQKDTR